MNEKNPDRVHWSFWLIGIVALLWNLAGVMNYLWQLSPDAISSMPESHRAVVEGRPAWATAGFAVGVFGGALGCVLLLLRKPVANYFFVLSLVGVVVTMIHTFMVIPMSALSTAELVLMTAMPLVVAALLIWYTKRCDAKGWL